VYQGIHDDREPCMSFAVSELLREAVEQLPEDATVEDAMDRLYFLAKVARGLEAADRGEVVSHQQVRSVILGDDGDDAR
jgi:predicted transcriptional regulator